VESDCVADRVGRRQSQLSCPFCRYSIKTPPPAAFGSRFPDPGMRNLPSFRQYNTVMRGLAVHEENPPVLPSALAADWRHSAETISKASRHTWVAGRRVTVARGLARPPESFHAFEPFGHRLELRQRVAQVLPDVRRQHLRRGQVVSCEAAPTQILDDAFLAPGERRPV
jgi:hypothetical protein